MYRYLLIPRQFWAFLPFTVGGSLRLIITAGPCTDFSRLQLSWFAIDNRLIVVFCLLGYSWPFSAHDLQINWFANRHFQPTPYFRRAAFHLCFFCSDRKKPYLRPALLFLSLAVDMFVTGHFLFVINS